MAPRETFTAQERARLAPFVSDLDAPVFALKGLPETTRGALFARYSRYPGTLRRLLLDEFGEELDRAHPDGGRSPAGARAEALYERVLGEYGDDSVAQLGGAHIACEWVSNVLTKVLQRPRLGAYLEQSTRYIAYDRPLPGGGYRYHRDPELGPSYEQAMESLFATYATLLPRLEGWLAERFAPESGAPGAAHDRAVRAKALDLLRGLLPAAALSHVGIFASGQTFERLIMHLRAHPLPEARRCGEGMLVAMRAVAPSFVTRVDRADRGGEWVEYLIERTAAQERAARRLGLDTGAEEEEKKKKKEEKEEEEPAGARLLRAEGDEQRLLAALVFEQSSESEAEALARVAQLDERQRRQLLEALLGGRANRRHLPGRGLEALRYRFEIVSDYGAFRDLQRHRMLTVQWQALSPHLGAEVPEEIQQAGLSSEFRRGLECSREAWQRLVDEGLEQHAPYALCLAYRVRYVLDLNAREAMHLIELRSGREGHSAYRAIAQQMHEQIAAVHPAVAAAMTYLDDTEEPRLERLAAETRHERRAAG
jgi:thymidylate synthase ThyX